MSESSFNPNRLTFEEGIQRILEPSKRFSIDRNKIITSLDEGVSELLKVLKVDNVPEGFTKYQLPVFMMDTPGIQFFFSSGNPDSKVNEHAHTEGDGLRFIVSGSIMYEGKELKAGDWMFIPKGVPYSFDVGSIGVGIFYCYECCCA